MGLAEKFSARYARLLEAVYHPILFSALLALILWVRRSGWQWTILHLFCITSLLVTPLANNYKYTVMYPKIKERYDLVFYPFEVFSDRLDIEEDDLFYVSTEIKNEMEMLSKDPNDITGMYNFYFDARITPENVFIGYNRKKIGSDLTNRNFSHVLLSAYDVQQLKQSSIWDSIQSEFDHFYHDEIKSVYLLVR